VSPKARPGRTRRQPNSKAVGIGKPAALPCRHRTVRCRRYPRKRAVKGRSNRVSRFRPRMLQSGQEKKDSAIPDKFVLI